MTSHIETADELLANARALAPLLRNAAEEIDQARRLPPNIVGALRDAGCFRMSMPRVWGGCEVDPMAQNRVIEAISAASGSAGWCVMIGAANAYFTAFLDQAVARKMFPDVNMVIAGALAPPARAIVAPGGYRVTGRLPFGSGITHADWVAAGAVAFDNGQPVAGPDGSPKRFWALAPIEQVEVLDTWHSNGLKGSGSNDFVFNDLFVPAERVFTLDHPSEQRAGPLYQLPTLFLANHPGVPLGIGRGAIEEFTAIIRDKPPKFGVAARDQPSVQAALANAVVLVESARAFVFESLGALWESLVAGRETTTEERVRLRLATTHAHDACARAVQQLYHAAGSASVYVPNVLDRHFRDIHTADQHVIAGGVTYEAGGKALLTGTLPLLW
ncbi:MAG: acyl-CoA dehydrogenase family protein [Anaerolineaceae bacterium]